MKQINKICNVSRKYIFIALSLYLFGCKTTFEVSPKPTEGMRVQNVKADAEMERKIVPYRDALKLRLSEEVVYSPTALEKGLPESELSNVIADAVFWRAKIWCDSNASIRPQICLLNNGGIRTALPAGTLTLGHMYEVMPFENEIVLLKLSPEKIRALTNYIANVGGSPIAGFRMKINGTVAENVEIDQSLYLYDREVWVATSDFLAFGGDGMTFFDEPIEYIETKVKVRDAITAYFKSFRDKGLPLDAKKDGRIYK